MTYFSFHCTITCHMTSPNFLSSEDEGKLLDEITGGMATNRMKSRDPFSGGLPHPPSNALRTSQGFGTGPKTGGGYTLWCLMILLLSVEGTCDTTKCLIVNTWVRSCENISYAICEQQRCRSACASMQSDQHLCCSLLR